MKAPKVRLETSNDFADAARREMLRIEQALEKVPELQKRKAEIGRASCRERVSSPV